MFCRLEKKIVSSKKKLVGWRERKIRLEKKIVGWKLFWSVGKKIADWRKKNLGRKKKMSVGNHFFRRLDRKVLSVGKYNSVGWKFFVCQLEKKNCRLEKNKLSVGQKNLSVGQKKIVGWNNLFALLT